MDVGAAAPLAASAGSDGTDFMRKRKVWRYARWSAEFEEQQGKAKVAEDAATKSDVNDDDNDEEGNALATSLATVSVAPRAVVRRLVRFAPPTFHCKI